MQLYAIDYNPATGNCRMAQSADTPISAPFTVRLLASDFAHLDTYEETPEELDAEGNVLVPASRKLVRPGVAIEYQRRADEWAASQPVPVKTYSKDEYDKALQEAITAHITSLPADYQDLAEVALLAAAPNPYQTEAQALVAWIGELWKWREKQSDFTIEPSALAGLMFEMIPAP